MFLCREYHCIGSMSVTLVQSTFWFMQNKALLCSYLALRVWWYLMSFLCNNLEVCSVLSRWNLPFKSVFYFLFSILIELVSKRSCTTINNFLNNFFGCIYLCAKDRINIAVIIICLLILMVQQSKNQILCAVFQIKTQIWVVACWKYQSIWVGLQSLELDVCWYIYFTLRFVILGTYNSKYLLFLKQFTVIPSLLEQLLGRFEVFRIV